MFTSPLSKRLTSLAPVLAIVTCLVTGSSATAGHQAPIIEASETYRNAVKDFERVVFRSDHMNRTERHVADALEDQTSRILARSRDLRRPDRVAGEFERARVIERQVESIVFANPACPSRILLAPSWQGVLIASDRLAAVIESLRYAAASPPIVAPACSGPSHGIPSHLSQGLQNGIAPSWNSYRVPVAPQGFVPGYAPRQGTIRYNVSPYRSPNFYGAGIQDPRHDAPSNFDSRSGSRSVAVDRHHVHRNVSPQRSFSRNDIAGYAIGALLSRMIQQ